MSKPIQTIHRRKLTRDFTVLPNELLRHAGLSFAARGILAMMLSHSSEWDASAGWLEEQTPKEGREAIRGALRELEREGYALKAVERGEGGQIARHVWTWYDAPVPRDQRSNALAWKKETAPAPLATKPQDGKPQVVDSTPATCGLPTCGFPTSGEPAYTEEPSSQKDHETEKQSLGGGSDLFLAGLEPEAKTPKAAKVAMPSDESLKTHDKVLALYAAYPRREAPVPARQAIWRALQKETFANLLAGVERYAIAVKGKERQHIAHPSTWFNAGRWADDYAQHTTHEKPNGTEQPKFW